jgi:Ca-activated chloride channel family protein
MTALCERWFGAAPHDPWALLLLALVPLAFRFGARRGAPAVVFAPAPLFTGAPPPPRSWRVRTHRLPEFLAAVGLALLVVALSRPVFRERLPRTSEGVDILLVLDRSASMLRDDLAAGRTRLAVAKEAAKAFVAGRPFDRIGLVTFARFPDLLCPPTLDHAALARWIDDVRPVAADGSEDATGVGGAAARAAELLRGISGTKVVVLLTDGVENVSSAAAPEEIPPLRAARFARDAGVRTYVIAASADGAADQAAADEVRRAAELTGGRFFAARDASALRAVYGAIDAAEKTVYAEPEYRLVERFAPWLLAGLACVLAARLLRATVWETLA